MSESRTRNVGPPLLWVAGLALVVAAGCHGGSHDGHGHSGPTRHVGAEVIVLDHGAALEGHPERPAAEFDHEAHTKALGDAESCESCHALDAEKRVVPRIKGAADISDMDELMDHYHDLCIGCHEQRAGAGQKTGPAACGECHVLQPAPSSDRQPLHFDLSLHQRHAESQNNACGTPGCHHVLNEETKALEHQPGTEGACHHCHGAADDGKRLSLANASHLACIGCHRRGAAEGAEKNGPQTCRGCHDREAQQQIERQKAPKRLLRGEPGQPDTMWIHTEGGESNLVAFNHKLHESIEGVRLCSDCHHAGMQKCGDCHGLTGGEKSGGVTLERAFHDPASERSCVGCHQKRIMDNPDCAACHYAMEQPPAEAACRACHSGPPPAHAKLIAAEDALRPREPPTVPEASDQLFPTDITIDFLAKEYQAAKLPHREIVAELAKRIGPNKLASRFHGDQVVPCAGCHHESPVGERPPSCRSCHTKTAHRTRDMPGLTAAYHRQCIGCHQQMGEETTCTGVCHDPAEGRGQQ